MSSTTPRERIRIWLWRLRYAWRIYTRTKAHEDLTVPYWLWCFRECALVGFEVAVQNEGSVEAALKTDPKDEADCELEAWTDG